MVDDTIERYAVFMAIEDEPWRREFPDLPHAPQDLDLVRRCLGWTPAERLANLRRVVEFVARARSSPWLRESTGSAR